MKKLKIDPTRQLRSASPKIPVSAVTRDLVPIIEPTGNLYESIVVMGRRARQIGAKEKAELTEKLAEFATGIDNLEEIFENREQIEISRHFEKQPLLLSIGFVANCAKYPPVHYQPFYHFQIQEMRPKSNVI